MASLTPDLTNASPSPSTSGTQPEGSSAPAYSFTPLFHIGQSVKREEFRSSIGRLVTSHGPGAQHHLSLSNQERLDDLKTMVDAHFTPTTDKQLEDELKMTTFEDYFNDDEDVTEKPFLGLVKAHSEKAYKVWQHSDLERKLATNELNKTKDKTARATGAPRVTEHNIKVTAEAAHRVTKNMFKDRHDKHKRKARELKKAHMRVRKARVKRQKQQDRTQAAREKRKKRDDAAARIASRLGTLPQSYK